MALHVYLVLFLTSKWVLFCQGNYDSFVQTKSELDENQQKRYKKEQDEIAHMKVSHCIILELLVFPGSMLCVAVLIFLHIILYTSTSKSSKTLRNGVMVNMDNQEWILSVSILTLGWMLLDGVKLFLCLSVFI